MPTIIDSLIISLSLDPSNFTKGQKEAAASFVKTRDQFKKDAGEMEVSGLKTAKAIDLMGSKFLELFAILTGARGLKDFVVQTTAADVALGNLSKNIQQSPQDMSAFALAVERAGGNADDATQSFLKWSDAVQGLRRGEIPGMMKELNQLQSLGGIKIDFRKPILQTMEDLAEDANIVSKKMGAAFANNLLRQIVDPSTANFLMQGRAGVEKALGETKPFAITQRDIDASRQLFDIWEKLAQSSQAFARHILTALTPEVVKMAQDIGDALKISPGGAVTDPVSGRPTGIDPATGKPIPVVLPPPKPYAPTDTRTLFDILQELFIGSGEAHGEELPPHPYAGHGPGRSPSGLASWRWDLARTGADTAGKFPDYSTGPNEPWLQGRSGNADDKIKDLSRAVEQFAAAIRLFEQLVVSLLTGTATSPVDLSAAPGAAAPSLWGRIKGAASNVVGSVFGSTPARGSTVPPGGPLAPMSSGVAKASQLADWMAQRFGISREVAMGPAAFMLGETGGTMSPTIVRPGGTDTGYAQWVGQRRAQLLARGPLSDETNRAQLEYELTQGGYQGVLRKLRGAKTAEEAFQIWAKDFEGAGGTPLGLGRNLQTHLPFLRRLQSFGQSATSPTGGAFPAWLDERSRRELSAVNAPLVHDLLDAAAQSGVHFSVSQGLRTPAEAAANAARGIGVRNSQHLYGAAADLKMMDAQGRPTLNRGVYQLFANVFEAIARSRGQSSRWLGNVGGRWASDIYHFDQGLGYGEAHARDPYGAGGPTAADVKAGNREMYQSPANPFYRGRPPPIPPPISPGASGAPMQHTSSAETNIHQLHVHSAAQDAGGMAYDIKDALKRTALAVQANYGPA